MSKTKSIHIEETIDKVKKVERDELADLIVEIANKSQKDGARVAFFFF